MVYIVHRNEKILQKRAIIQNLSPQMEISQKCSTWSSKIFQMLICLFSFLKMDQYNIVYKKGIKSICDLARFFAICIWSWNIAISHSASDKIIHHCLSCIATVAMLLISKAKVLFMNTNSMKKQQNKQLHCVIIYCRWGSTYKIARYLGWIWWLT